MPIDKYNHSHNLGFEFCRAKALWNTHYEFWWKIRNPKYINKSNQ